MLRAAIVGACILWLSPATAETLRVAVASNFTRTAQALVAEFEQGSTHRVVLVNGATGRLATQIMQGLPVDVFLAADSERPRMLEQQGLAVAGSRVSYALGKLVLISSGDRAVDHQTLTKLNGQRLAIANARLAPYGRAAEQVLQTLGVWSQVEPNLVRGDNIAQTYQYVKTGHTPYGLAALAQVKHSGQPYWLVPEGLYQPIHQQAILIKSSEAGKQFISFLQSVKALRLIHQHGYDTP
jgi:molybdate transport system substrate-binding protein